MLTVIGYYTPGYANDAQRLRRSLNRVGMNHELVAVEERGDWYANTAYKPVFIRQMSHTAIGPMLYVDVDAVFHEDCTHWFDKLNGRYDFGCHYFPSMDGWTYDANIKRLLSGTLWIGDNDKARQLLDNWCAMNELFRGRGLTEGGGQKNLWYLTTCMKGLRIKELPGRYCYVFDKPWAYPDDHPVIEHTIASRDNRGPQSGGPLSDARHRRIAEIDRWLDED